MTHREKITKEAKKTKNQIKKQEKKEKQVANDKVKSTRKEYR